MFYKLNYNLQINDENFKLLNLLKNKHSIVFYILENIKKILSSFTPISLKEMDSVKLLNRIDTKFIFNIASFESVFNKIIDDYRILTINNKQTAHYKTLYYDTENFSFYNDHHNRKGNRYKVRIRKYIDSDLCYLEIKNKKKGRTIKSRIKIEDFEKSLSTESIHFISEIIPNVDKLDTKIWNNFERITLVNRKRKERLTIDLNLSFEHDSKIIEMNNLVICELKQEKVARNSPVFNTLKLNNIRPTRISKYCIGAGLIYLQLKKNRFKEKYLKIEKMNHGNIWN